MARLLTIEEAAQLKIAKERAAKQIAKTVRLRLSTIERLNAMADRFHGRFPAKLLVEMALRKYQRLQPQTVVTAKNPHRTTKPRPETMPLRITTDSKLRGNLKSYQVDQIINWYLDIHEHVQPVKIEVPQDEPWIEEDSDV